MAGTIVVPSVGATFPGSGTKSLAQIRGDIATIAGVKDDPAMEALATKFLNDIIDDLNRRQSWLFNLITGPNITTVAGTSEYDLPADFARAYSVRKQDAIDFTLSMIGQKNFDTRFQSQAQISGLPFLAVVKNTFRGGVIQLFPTPDGVYTISLNYFKLIGRFTQDSDTLDLPLQYESVVTNGAQAKMMATVSQFEAAKYWSDLFERDYQYMKRDDENAGMEDDGLRFVNIEEGQGINYLAPASRPRAYDFF